MKIMRKMFQWLWGKKHNQAWAESNLTVEEIKFSQEQGLELKASHPGFVLLANELSNMLDEAGAENYIEYRMWSDKKGYIRVTIQKECGETPAQQVQRLKWRVAELEGMTGENE